MLSTWAPPSAICAWRRFVLDGAQQLLVAELLRHLLCGPQLHDLLFEFAPGRRSRCSWPKRREVGVAGGHCLFVKNFVLHQMGRSTRPTVLIRRCAYHIGEPIPELATVPSIPGDNVILGVCGRVAVCASAGSSRESCSRYPAQT